MKCFLCQDEALITISFPDGLRLNLCLEHTAVPKAGDTMETMWERWRTANYSLGICQVSLCGRDGEEMYNDAPVCQEHHLDMVAIATEKEESMASEPILDRDDYEMLEELVVEAMATAIVVPDEFIGGGKVLYLSQLNNKLVRLRHALPEIDLSPIEGAPF